MTTTEARNAHLAALAIRTDLVAKAGAVTGTRASRTAWLLVEQAAQDVTFAAREVEMAVRREMVGATEAEIQTAARAA